MRKLCKSQHAVIFIRIAKNVDHRNKNIVLQQSEWGKECERRSTSRVVLSGFHFLQYRPVSGVLVSPAHGSLLPGKLHLCI